MQPVDTTIGKSLGQVLAGRPESAQGKAGFRVVLAESGSTLPRAVPAMGLLWKAMLGPESARSKREIDFKQRRDLSV